jgi:ankyrin repeat protein
MVIEAHPRLSAPDHGTTCNKVAVKRWWQPEHPDKSGQVEKAQQDDLDAQLAQAAFVCDFVKVRELLGRGANPDVRDEDLRTPLHQAVLGSSVGLVGLLIESGADLNAKDSHGFTPLHFAAQEHLPEIARILLGRGADPNAVDEDGNSVLHRAIQSARDRDEIARLLLEGGARDDLANHEGVTPRELAERLGSRVFSAN